MTKYYPIDCNFYDELIQMIQQQKICSIDYQDENKVFYKLESRLKDIYTKDTAEYLLLENELEIRLDYLHKVGGIVSPSVLDRGNSCGA